MALTYPIQSYLLVFVLTLKTIDRPDCAGLAWDWCEVYKGKHRFEEQDPDQTVIRYRRIYSIFNEGIDL